VKNIGVLVSGGGTNLQALIDAQEQGILHSGRIALVLSSTEDAYALERAKKHGIPTAVVRRKGLKRQTFTARVVKTLQEHNIDLVIFAGFMCILDEQYSEAFENRGINVHPALIPSFCGEGYYGLHVHEAVLAYGVKLTGATVHFVSPVTDGGPIILQKAIDVLPDDTPETLQKRVMEQCEWQILPQAAELFCADKLSVNGRIVEIKE